jgi:hypothetical protein
MYLGCVYNYEAGFVIYGCDLKKGDGVVGGFLLVCGHLIRAKFFAKRCEVLSLFFRRVKHENKMTMKTNFIVAGLMACFAICAQAQEGVTSEPKGKAIVLVFSGFYSGFGADNDDRGFDMERSYLGYQYDLGKGLSVKGVMDIGKSSNVTDMQRIAYIKNAMISWKSGDWTLSGGLIPTTISGMVEKHWGYRYIYMGFQHHYGFGSSADLGVSATWKGADWVSLDGIVVNGEGYKKIQNGDGLLYGLGATFTPVGGLIMRLYAGINEQNKEGQKDVMNYSAFIGYKGDKFSVGAEYNVMENTKGKEDLNQTGVSVYGTLKTGKNSEVFARFDDLSSNDGWNEVKNDFGKYVDQSMLMVGAQWKVGKYVKIAPNFRVTMPKADGADEKYYGYISCYFGL